MDYNQTSSLNLHFCLYYIHLFTCLSSATYRKVLLQELGYSSGEEGKDLAVLELNTRGKNHETLFTQWPCHEEN
jgi:hypothetical protein